MDTGGCFAMRKPMQGHDVMWEARACTVFDRYADQRDFTDGLDFERPRDARDYEQVDAHLGRRGGGFDDHRDADAARDQGALGGCRAEALGGRAHDGAPGERGAEGLGRRDH
jgi:hypothetical protein